MAAESAMAALSTIASPSLVSTSITSIMCASFRGTPSPYLSVQRSTQVDAEPFSVEPEVPRVASVGVHRHGDGSAVDVARRGEAEQPVRIGVRRGQHVPSAIQQIHGDAGNARRVYRLP